MSEELDLNRVNSAVVKAVKWSPCLLIPGEPLPDGIATNIYEHLPGLFATSREAMAVAHAVVVTRPDAIGCCARPVEIGGAA